MSKLSNVYRILSERGWREVLVRIDQTCKTNYFDFSAVSISELGLDPQRSVAYRSSAADVHNILSQIPIEPGTSIIDIGAGKAQAMIAMARFPFKIIAGVEISPKLAEIGRRNLSRAFLRKRSELIASCAAEFEDYDRFSYFYFFNPFCSSVLRDVMTHIRSSLLGRPRRCWLIYNAVTTPEVDEIICAGVIFKRDFEHRPVGRRPIVVYRHQPAA